jgi:hypothetical protein
MPENVHLMAEENMDIYEKEASMKPQKLHNGFNRHDT